MTYLDQVDLSQQGDLSQGWAELSRDRVISGRASYVGASEITRQGRDKSRAGRLILDGELSRDGADISQAVRVKSSTSELSRLLESPDGKDCTLFTFGENRVASAF